MPAFKQTGDAMALPHPMALRVVRALCRCVLRLLRIRVQWQGAEPANGGALLVANHFSWLDIVAVLASTDCSFVAKREVRRWPIVGWCAEAIGVVWIDRTRKRDLLRSLPLLRERLAAGQRVLLFPEGTTTDGRAVLPFRSALYDAAVWPGVPVQALALTASARGNARVLSWTGRDTLLGSLTRLVRLRDARVDITALPTMSATVVDSRAARRQARQLLARQTRAAIVQVVGRDAIRTVPSEAPAAALTDATAW